MGNYLLPRLLPRKSWIILLFSVLAACGLHPRGSTVSLRGDALLAAWKCDDPAQRAIAEAKGPDGTPASVAQKLLQCPFYRDYQIEAMQRGKGRSVDVATLSEIISKMRWGIDFQYHKYETYILSGTRKKYLIPRFLVRAIPGATNLLELSGDLIDEPIEMGKSSPLIIRQMQTDRAATGDAIDQRLAAFSAGKKTYPLWQAIIDLDAYFYAGTGISAMESLNQRLAPMSKLSQAY